MDRLIFMCLSLFLGLIASFDTYGQTLQLLKRSEDAVSASELAVQLEDMPRNEREERIYAEFEQGNVPDFLRNLWKIEDSVTIGKRMYHFHYYCTPDYLAIGSNEDYLLIPMSPSLAQRIANVTHSTLPTAKMVDQIYQQTPQKLRPQPIPPSPEMTTIPIFVQHGKMVKEQKDSLGLEISSTLTAGHKKDVIISNKIYQQLKPKIPKPVVIYGWHRLNGKPIQPVYNGHGEKYADYSHGIRLVQAAMWVNGRKRRVHRILKSKKLHVLLSGEGRIKVGKYGF